MKTILVTGAKGTVGSYLIGLAEAAGYRVVASDLSTTGVGMPVRGEVRTADLRNADDVERLVQGCDAVIHTAAQLEARAHPAELAQTNTDAVARLYGAAARAGVKRFVHMSTATLYAPGHDERRAEGSEIAPRGAYGMSKHGAEVFLRGQSNDPPWTVLRAAPLYGRRGRHFAASLLAIGPILRLLTPIVPRFSGGPLGSMVHAEDVARALLFVLQRDDAKYQIFNVADDDIMPLGERVALTLHAYGMRTVNAGRLPPSLLHSLGRSFQTPVLYQGADATALAAWRLVVMRYGLKPALRPHLDREGITFLYDSLVVDSSKLRALGWRPRFSSFERGWREVLEWYQAERWVPRYGA